MRPNKVSHLVIILSRAFASFWGYAKMKASPARGTMLKAPSQTLNVIARPTEEDVCNLLGLRLKSDRPRTLSSTALQITGGDGKA